MSVMKEKNPCETTECRVEMLDTMFKTVKGYSLLLEAIQPDPQNFDYNSAKIRKKYAFKTLIATMLSVRSRDETTIKVIENLWKVYSTPKALANVSLEELEVLIRSSGTYRQKAKRIKETSRIIHEEYNDIVPDNLDDLLKFPGVGRKVANCVLVVSFNKPAIPVDTHVHRISNRTGWVSTHTPEKTEKALEKIFPRDTWTKINYTMVSFGKMICKPINPKCDKCPVIGSCKQLIVRPKSKVSSQDRKRI
ncbi:MAG: endonuclease III domain-containing protein [Promethearchaeota archaeon]